MSYHSAEGISPGHGMYLCRTLKWSGVPMVWWHDSDCLQDVTLKANKPPQVC